MPSYKTRGKKTRREGNSTVLGEAVFLFLFIYAFIYSCSFIFTTGRRSPIIWTLFFFRSHDAAAAAATCVLWVRLKKGKGLAPRWCPINRCLPSRPSIDDDNNKRSQATRVLVGCRTTRRGAPALLAGHLQTTLLASCQFSQLKMRRGGRVLDDGKEKTHKMSSVFFLPPFFFWAGRKLSIKFSRVAGGHSFVRATCPFISSSHYRRLLASCYYICRPGGCKWAKVRASKSRTAVAISLRHANCGYETQKASLRFFHEKENVNSISPLQ